MEATSVPAFGSVTQYAPIFSPDAIAGRYFCLSSSEPNWLIISQASELWTDSIIAKPAQAALISSITPTKLAVDCPNPPYCSGTVNPK